MSNSRDTVLILLNRRAGARSRSREIGRLAATLERDGWSATMVDSLASLATGARELEERGRLKLVVAAGGDGTLAAVANRVQPGTPLAVYPMGTENLVARYLGYRRSPNRLAALLRWGRPVAIDAGQAGSKLFVLMISAGFDAEVVRQVAEARTGNIRRWTYAKPLLRAMRTYKYPALRVHWDVTGDALALPTEMAREAASVRWVFGMNLSKYAFGLNFTPAAVGTDGLLDVCTFSEGSVAQVFRYAWGVFWRRHLKYRDASFIQCRTLRIEAPEGVHVPYQLDGDFGGYLPVDVRVLPGRLLFLLEPHAAERITVTQNV